ncbi:MAG: monovalent cation/H(+) antiporter subunit G [Anaerolineae bacterium]
MNEILGLAAISIGVFFSVVGIIGMMRMPDIYTRLHAAGKVSTLGILSLLIGASFLMSEVTLKALALGLFLLVTAPVASHAIASAAHRQGTPHVQFVRDDMEAAYKE